MWRGPFGSAAVAEGGRVREGTGGERTLEVVESCKLHEGLRVSGLFGSQSRRPEREIWRRGPPSEHGPG